MRTIPFSEFKSKFHALLNAVHDTREPIRITRKGKLLVEDSSDSIGRSGGGKTPRGARRPGYRITQPICRELNADALDSLENHADTFDHATPHRVKTKSRKRQR